MLPAGTIERLARHPANDLAKMRSPSIAFSVQRSIPEETEEESKKVEHSVKQEKSTPESMKGGKASS